MKVQWIGCASLAGALAFAGWGSGMAEMRETGLNGGVTPVQFVYEATVGDVEAALAEQGYTRIVVVDEEPPYRRALACRDDSDYGLTLDDDGVAIESARIGPCGGEASGRVRAGYTDPDRRDVHVRAPFADVDVDERGVRVRAPFVDIDIPRRR